MADEFLFATRKDFVAATREKFPGAYDDLSDNDLYDGVISKYPVYAQQIKENFDGSTVPDPALPKGTAVNEKVSSPLPEGWVGRAPNADLMTIPGGDRLLKTAKRNESSRRGFVEGLTDVDEKDVPFAGDFFTANKIREALTTYKKIDKGEEVTDEELVGFNNWLATSRRMENSTWQGKAGDVVRGSIKFMVEIGATMAAVASPFDAFTGDAAAIGSLTGGKAAKKAATEAGEAFLRKEANRLGQEVVKKESLNAMQKAGYNRAVNEAGYAVARSSANMAVKKKLVTMLGEKAPTGVIGKKAVDMAAGALVASADIGIKGLVLTAANPGLANSKIAGQQLRQYLNNGTEDQGRAVIMGLMDAFNENASEMAGYTAGKAFGLWVPPKIKETLVKNTLFRIAAGKVGPESAQQWMRRAGFNGMLEEMYEERVSGFASGLLGLSGDDRAGLGKAIEEMIPGVEQMKTEALAFSLPGVAMATAGYAKGTEALGGVGWKNLEENLRNITMKINAETKPEERVRLQKEYDDAKKFILEKQQAERANPGYIDRFMKAKFGKDRVKAGSIDDLLGRMNMEQIRNVRANAVKNGQDPEQAASDYVDNFLGKNAYIVEDEQRGIAVQARIRSNQIRLYQNSRGSVWEANTEEIEADPKLKHERVWEVLTVEQAQKKGLEAEESGSGAIALDELSLVEETPSKDPDDPQTKESLVMASNTEHPRYRENVRKLGKLLWLPEHNQAAGQYDLIRDLMRIENKKADGAVFQIGSPIRIRDTAGNLRNKAGYAIDPSIPDTEFRDYVPLATNGVGKDGKWTITLNPGARQVDTIEDYIEMGLKRSNLYGDAALNGVIDSVNKKAVDALVADPKNPTLKMLVEWGKDPGHRAEFIGKLYVTGRLAVYEKDRAAFNALSLDPAHVAILDRVMLSAVGKEALDRLNKSATEIVTETPAEEQTSTKSEMTELPPFESEITELPPLESFSLALEERLSGLERKPITLASTSGDHEVRQWIKTNYSDVLVVFGDENSALIYDKSLGLKITYKGGADKLSSAYQRGIEIKLADAKAGVDRQEKGFVSQVNASTLKTILKYNRASEIPAHLVRDLVKAGLNLETLGEWFTGPRADRPTEEDVVKNPKLLTAFLNTPEGNAGTPEKFNSRFAEFKNVISSLFDGKATAKQAAIALDPFFTPTERSGWEIPEGITGRSGEKIDRLGFTRGSHTVELLIDSAPYQDGLQSEAERPDETDQIDPVPLNDQQRARLAGAGEQGPNDLNIMVDGIDVEWNPERESFEYLRRDPVVERYVPYDEDKNPDAQNKTGSFKNVKRKKGFDERPIKAASDVGMFSSVFNIDSENIMANGELADQIDSTTNDQADETEAGQEDNSADMAEESSGDEVTPKQKKEIALNEAVMSTVELEDGHEIQREEYNPEVTLKDQGINVIMVGNSAIADLSKDIYRLVPEVTPSKTLEKGDVQRVVRGNKVRKVVVDRKTVELKNNPVKFMASDGAVLEANAPQFAQLAGVLHTVRDNGGIIVLLGRNGVLQDVAVASRYRRSLKDKDGKWINRNDELIPDGQPASQGFYARILEWAVNGMLPLARAGETMDDLSPHLNTDYRTPYKSRIPVLVIKEGMPVADMSAAIYSFIMGSGAKNIVLANYDMQKTPTKAAPGQWISSDVKPALVQALNVARGTDRVVEAPAMDNGIEYRHVAGLPYVEMTNGDMDVLAGEDQNDIERRLAMQPSNVNREVDTSFEVPNLRGKPGLWDPIKQESLRKDTSFSLAAEEAVNDTIQHVISKRLLSPAQANRMRIPWLEASNDVLGRATEQDAKYALAGHPLLMVEMKNRLRKEITKKFNPAPVAVPIDLAAEQVRLEAIRAEIGDNVAVNENDIPGQTTFGFSLADIDTVMEQLFPYVLSGDTAMLNVLLARRREQKVFLHDAHRSVQTWQQAVGARAPHGHGMFKKWDGSKGKLVLRAIGARIDDPKATYIPIRPGEQIVAPTPSQRAEYMVITEDTPIDQILADYNATKTAEQPAWEAVMADIQEKTEAMRKQMNDQVSQYGEKEWIAFLENYITHRYLGGNKDKEKAKVFVKRFAETTNREEARQLPTYTKAVSLGLTPMTLDAAELYGMWAEDVGRVVLNKMMMNAYAGMVDSDGSPLMLVVPTTMDVKKSVIAPEVIRAMISNMADWLEVKVPEGSETQQLKILADQIRTTGDYKEIDSPFESISQIFVKNGQPYRYVEMFIGQPFKNAPVQFLERLNGWMKFMALGVPLMSFFHPFSLLESFIATIGLHNNPVITGVADLFQMKRPRAVTELTDLLNRIRQDPTLADPWIEAGMELNFNHPDIAMGMIDKDIRGFIENVRTHGFPASEHIAQGLESFLGFKQKWDNWLWNTFQPTLKLHTAQGVYNRRMEEADRLGEYVNKDLLMQDVARYMNDSYGGQEWESYWFATPKFKQLMHLLAFAPDWTISSANSAGIGNLPIIKQTWAHPSSDVAVNEMIRHSWPAMLLIVLGAIPAFLQFSMWTVSRAFGGDPDDKPLPFMNEHGKESHVDITPMLRMVGYKGGETGKRRIYLRWGKQAYEVIDGWMVHPFKTALAKSSQLVKMAIEQATGTSGGGWDLPFKDAGLMGALRVNGKFLDSRAGYVVRHFSPYVILNVIDGYPVGYFAPASRGNSKWSMTNEMQDIFESYADAKTFDLLQQMGKTDKLKERVVDVMDNAERNGYQGEEIFNRAIALVRTKYYGDFFKALNAGDNKKTEQMAGAIVRLNGNINGLETSMANRFRSVGKEWSSELLSERVRSKFD